MRGAFWIFLMALLAACGGAPKDAKHAGSDVDEAPRGKPPQAVTGHLVATIEGRTIGPFLTRYANNRGAFVTWITPGEGSGRRIMGLPLGPSGEQLTGEKPIARIGVDPTVLVTKAMRTGFAVAWSQILDKGESIGLACVGDDGVPRNKPLDVAHSDDHVIWVDIVAVENGAIVVWAEETHAGDANLLAVGVDTDGKLRGVPDRIARGVTGWHALSIAGGAGITFVQNKTLTYLTLDSDGHPGKEGAVVAKNVNAADIEVVRDGARLLFAWTEKGADPFIAIAAVGEAPKKLVTSRGGASLLGLTAGPSGLYAMFQSPVKRGDRSVHVARVSKDLALEPTAFHLLAAEGGVPELVSTASGVAMVATTKDCEEGKCADASFAPVMIRLDSKMNVVQRESFTFGADPASLAWNLSCNGDACFTLAASGAAPSRVRVAEIAARENVRRGGAMAQTAGTEPGADRVTEVSALVSGQIIQRIAVAHFGENTIMATLGQGAKGLSVETRLVDASGAVKDPVLITSRALAVGGVAIAAAQKPEEGGAMAWVAKENGDPEVHVTRLDKKGKRTNDALLTTTKGDASDVAIVWADGGFIVAWVDGRDGNGEVYATRIGMDLNRVAREERLTNAPGDATDLVAMARGSEVWLAWADSRDTPKEGLSDIFVTSIRMRDAKRANDETKVLGTAAHSHSPQLASAGDNVHVAWIEGGTGPETAANGAMWGMLDAKGKVASKPVKLGLGEGAPTSLAIESSGGALRGVVARSKSDAVALDAFEIPTGAAPRVSPLLTLDGPPSLDVSLALDGTLLYFNDDGPTLADKRARRARLVW